MVEEQKQQITEEIKGENSVGDEKPAEVKENGTTEGEIPLKNGKPENGGSKVETKTDEEKKEENEDEDDESSDEELGLLEKPIEILYTKRERKSVEAYVEKPKEEKKETELDYSKGKGVKLGEIPIIKYNIGHADTEDLGVLHRMMYRKAGKQHNTKKNVREFCGWPFGKDAKEYRSAMNIVDRLLPAALKWTLDLLAVDRKDKDTEEMRKALVEFLEEPKMNEQEIPTSKPSSAKQKSSATPKTKKAKATPKSKSKKTKKDEGSDVSDVSADDSESEDEENKKSKKKTNAKSPSKKATPVKFPMPGKKSKSASKKKKDSSDESEDDQPLTKKSKSPPSNAELKKVVSAILKDADLEQVTMKSVVKQVYDKYSQFDLTSRKDFIKTTVKELIS